jgi:16S rRNA (adenine1518-N6/adenine1519-N6)-dimethyltransferase
MKNNLTSSQYIKEIMKQHGAKFTRSLGQNFLKDPFIVESIIETAELTKDDVVIEIGPGIGVMTDKIAQEAGHVFAVEIDRKLIPILEQTLSERDNVTLINEDVLKLDLEALRAAHFPDKRPKIIANLPYYITTPIIMMFLESGFEFESMTVMMQKEVAERIVSPPGKKSYGSLSVAVQYYTQSEKALQVPRSSFVPEPNVDSTVLLLKPHRAPIVDVADHAMFLRTIKAAFSTRRKTLLNALSNDFDKGTVKEALAMAEIDPGLRGERLDIVEFAKLANAFSKIVKSS